MLIEHAERADEAMDVIAAGGGPVGLMTAALLDMAGVRVEVYERGSEPTRQSQGTAMHPRTLEALKLAATRTVRPDSHATHSVTVIPAVN
jgi:2-polyprenyl-6-methoxyphenol hydroxylase-like FAD-dependent oxidoreductase